MSTYHRHLETRLKKLGHNIKDAMDIPHHHSARRIVNDVQKGEDMAEVARNLRSIEHTLISVMRQFKQSQTERIETRVISTHDANRFYREIEIICDEIRRQPNY